LKRLEINEEEEGSKGVELAHTGTKPGALNLPRGARAAATPHTFRAGFRIQALGFSFSIQVLGFRVWGLGCGIQSLGFRLQVLGFRVESIGVRV